jgi:isopenicillin-N N-acyltransferase like protein
MFKRILKIAAWFFGILVILLIGVVFYVRSVSVIKPPQVDSALAKGIDPVPTQPDSGLYKIGGNWFRKSESGLYELYVEGQPYERGVIIGRLTKELVRYQEEVFTRQINQLVPSKNYLNVLKYFVGYFNRNLPDYIPEEYQLEILGVSQAASEDFNYIAEPYQRILNYHAAHDIGHALQNMSLVGCTSFATWGPSSADSSLIIARNFDFYVGDDFARDKIVAFYKPADGYKFMMITFGGMTGVLSGMNDQGLTVTINAAKSDIPSSAATPVSLVAREILQYASTIDEAYAIAAKRPMFVAESFLIGSARDKKAALIERSPDGIDLFTTTATSLISTNHFQGEKLGNTELNREHIRTSASPYRYERVRQLLDKDTINSVQRSVRILRNQKGLDDREIGMGNEKLVNQLVAHHGIVFQPEKQLVWISTAPWQLGKFVCYDLNKVFGLDMQKNQEIYEREKMISADTFLLSAKYPEYVKFSKFRFPFNPIKDLQPDSLIKWNPDSYHAYMLAGDYYFEKEKYAEAARTYEHGLTKEIATLQEKEHMEKNLAKCKEKLP